MLSFSICFIVNLPHSQLASVGGGLLYSILVLSCFTCHLSFQNRNEAVNGGWFPASEADRRDKFKQDLAATAGLLPVCSHRAPCYTTTTSRGCFPNYKRSLDDEWIFIPFLKHLILSSRDWSHHNFNLKIKDLRFLHQKTFHMSSVEQWTDAVPKFKSRES